MASVREERRVGLDAVRAMTALLRRAHRVDPAHGVYQAAELEFWWTVERSTDVLEQCFWFDDDGPVAAATITDFGDGTSPVYDAPILVPVVLPGAAPEWLGHVIDRGVARAEQVGIGALSVEVDRADTAMRDVLARLGFAPTDDGVVACWLDPRDRPAISALPDGYRLAARSDVPRRTHHLSGPRRPHAEQRLHETTLYRPDLDLVVLAPDDEVAGYCVFWVDPVTTTGVVEPMRTRDDHQRRGIGRHLLTTGLDLLARAGATRVSIAYEPDNPASGALYRSVGFVPRMRTDVHARA